MLQEAQVDLTKFLPPWVQVLGILGLGVYFIVRYIRRGKRAEDEDRDAEIEKKVKPYREQTENAERLKGQYREELESERRAHAECEKRVERLTERLEIESETKDELQTKVMRLLARLEKAETRIEVLEGDKSAGSDR